MSNARQGDGEEVGWLRAQLARVTAERDQLQQHLEARRELDAMLMTSAPAADGTGPLPAVPASRARSHRARPTHLRLLPGFVLAAFASLRWAWHVHRAATVAAGVLSFTAATGAAVAVAPHGPIAQAFGAVPVAPAPAASIYGAAPMPSAIPSSVAYLRPALDAKSAGPPVSVLVPSPASPSPSPSQSSQPSPSDTPSPPDTFAADFPQPTWQDTTGGGHHRQWDRQDSPSPTGTPADTSTPTAAPDTGTPAVPADTSAPSPAAS